MIPSPKQNIASMLTGSVKTYRRNFVKLYLIFFVLFILLMLPILVNLNMIVTQIHETVKTQDQTTVFFTIAYIVRPMLGLFTLMAALIWVIEVLATPLLMGMAGKIASDDAVGIKCTLANALRWTLGQYKRLLTAYALYYTISTAFGASFFALLYWMVEGANHLVRDVWFYPFLAIYAVVGVFILLGTIYLPFVAMDEQKSSFRAYTGSFKDMYSKKFFSNLPGLILAAVIACVISFAALYPVAPPLFSGEQNQAMFFLTGYSGVLSLMLVAAAVFSLVGVFLYIFAYNTYRNATKVLHRIENVSKTYRRKLNVVEPTYRRRIG
jgi:hypothetical protein